MAAIDATPQRGGKRLKKLLFSKASSPAAGTLDAEIKGIQNSGIHSQASRTTTEEVFARNPKHDPEVAAWKQTRGVEAEPEGTANAARGSKEHWNEWIE
jgi:hypothetical protein